MEYKEIKLNVSNNKIREYKQFEGMKLYSDFFKSEDGRKLTNKRVYVTRKQNYVYYEIIFEISSELSTFSKHLGKELIEKIELKYKNGEILEILDI